jgi:NADH:ubiquinone oxidoreductase subunit F (NADH-binding)
MTNPVFWDVMACGCCKSCKDGIAYIIRVTRIGKLGKRRMVSSGMLRSVALVINDDSEELSASFIRVTRIGEL